jgi:hypothetical protein
MMLFASLTAEQLAPVQHGNIKKVVDRSPQECRLGMMVGEYRCSRVCHCCTIERHVLSNATAKQHDAPHPVAMGQRLCALHVASPFIAQLPGRSILGQLSDTLIVWRFVA